MHATLIVRDNGIGIPPENMDKIRNPLFTTKPGSDDNGLGLNFFYNIVTNILGGQIGVGSQVREGACSILAASLIAPRLRAPGAGR
ncbi:signal transduction histidine kinase [Chitinivorax tropicus]|uniref:histidine kinase n=1 Tax=Chitinivorax tropicus TaxID=714531 RepID=A0A840MN87_9PROT|nr:signal transduction histidine kinase [Chitinivorax tropicus]